MMRFLAGPVGAVLVALAAVGAVAVAAHAQSPGTEIKPIVPDAWQGDAYRPKPDLAGLKKIRFITDSDYPPFHYYDEVGALTGFNIDLAQAICDVLAVECEITATNWSSLMPALETGEADAAIASIRITAEALKSADFTLRYYATPARFAARKDSDIAQISPETVEGLKIGVAKDSGHEAYLKTFFPGAAVAAFESSEAAQKALKEGAIDLVFADGITLAFWFNGVESANCCEFRGGPYLDSRFFGEGVGIAVKKGNRTLVQALNYALEQVHARGTYEELFLRYFPMNFF
ncbi:transporter substrate-binding domain-containing protein [Methyloceanibacter caenitepidi]|uniref:Bacterial extracellular solute-binding protein, family 3 n=1 Tax=Methyloceanibacter caenitepidi TaxID=1384459 RepID=A0A0A8JZS9_9HYPH|nr:transporter substrate-binding domain-containing protein [Methyloceanibacter caenitepidi]BAQ16318.1 bacterial extracellular solute-binding protein, family 3 [Methyloceanibacter caenitepidi]